MKRTTTQAQSAKQEYTKPEVKKHTSVAVVSGSKGSHNGSYSSGCSQYSSGYTGYAYYY